LESVVTKNSVDAFVYERAERHARFCFDGNKQSRHLHRSVDTSSFFADRVAANAICTYVYRLPDHVETTRGNAVVAAIVAHSTGRGGDCDAPGAGDYLRTIGTALRLPQIRHTARFTSNAPVTVRTDYGRLFDQAIVQYTPNMRLTPAITNLSGDVHVPVRDGVAHGGYLFRRGRAFGVDPVVQTNLLRV
jgi:hypothetical protein